MDAALVILFLFWGTVPADATRVSLFSAAGFLVFGLLFAFGLRARSGDRGLSANS